MRNLFPTLATVTAILLAEAPIATPTQAMLLAAPGGARAAMEETSLVDQVRYICRRVCDRRGCQQVCQQRMYPRRMPDPTVRDYRPWWQRK